MRISIFVDTKNVMPHVADHISLSCEYAIEYILFFIAMEPDEILHTACSVLDVTLSN